MRRSTRVHPIRGDNELSSYPEKSTYCVKYFIFFMNILFWIVSCLILAIASYAMLEKQEIYGQISHLTTDPAVFVNVYWPCYVYNIVHWLYWSPERKTHVCSNFIT